MRHRIAIGNDTHDIWLAHGAYGDKLLLGENWHALPPLPADAIVITRGDTAYIHFEGRAYTVRFIHPVDMLAESADAGSDTLALAPMPGSVVSLNVSAGDPVKAGDAMLVIESMKLETVIRAARDGIIDKVHVAIGNSFNRDAALVTLVAGED